MKRREGEERGEKGEEGKGGKEVVDAAHRRAASRTSRRSAIHDQLIKFLRGERIKKKGKNTSLVKP